MPDGDVLLAIVADGAGSAKQAEIGSALACRCIRRSVASFLEESYLDQVTRRTVGKWVHAFQREIAAIASDSGLRVRDYACTLLAAMVGETRAVFFQVGDGSIVAADAEEGTYGHIFWPERGEYENATFFATDRRFAANLQFASVRRNIVEVAMFSDGLQRLALDFRKTMPHEPFFRGVFPAVRTMTAESTEQLNQALGSFLSSPRINARTDDDKTLILASRVVERKVLETNAVSEYAHSK